MNAYLFWTWMAGNPHGHIVFGVWVVAIPMKTLVFGAWAVGTHVDTHAFGVWVARVPMNTYVIWTRTAGDLVNMLVGSPFPSAGAVADN